MVVSNNDVSNLQVVIPLGYGVIDTIGLLFSGTPGMMLCIGVDNVPLVRVGVMQDRFLNYCFF